MTDLRAAALAPFPVHIEDARDNATWPSVPRYVFAWRFWFEKELREEIREAASEQDAASIASRHDPRYGHGEARRPEGGPPHAYWPAIEPMLWRRAVQERALQDAAFRAALARTDWSGDGTLLDTALAGMSARLRIADADRLRDWMLPPRMAIPWIARGSIGWRQGIGENYAMRQYDWRRSLGEADAALYDKAYPRDVA